MNPLETAAQTIVKEQELVIGPLAWSEAAKVQGLRVETQAKNLSIADMDQKAVIDRLVAQYERLFGRASHEVCREAVASLIKNLTPAEIPTSLRA